MPRHHTIEIPKILYQPLCDTTAEQTDDPVAATLLAALKAAVPSSSARGARGYRLELPAADLRPMWLLLAHTTAITDGPATPTRKKQLPFIAAGILTARIKAPLHDHFLAAYPLGARIQTPAGVQTIDCVTIQTATVQIRTYADGEARVWTHEQLDTTQEAIAS